MGLSLRFRFACALAIALGSFASQAGAMGFDSYEVSGRISTGAFPLAVVEGTVLREVGGSGFEIELANASSVGGPPYHFAGTYTELDLLFISFWSFEGTGDGTELASGSGIRLLFGLWFFGELSSLGFDYELSGVFAGQSVALTEGERREESVRGVGVGGCPAALDTTERIRRMRRRSAS